MKYVIDLVRWTAWILVSSACIACSSGSPAPSGNPAQAVANIPVIAPSNSAAINSEMSTIQSDMAQAQKYDNLAQQAAAAGNTSQANNDLQIASGYTQAAQAASAQLGTDIGTVQQGLSGQSGTTSTTTVSTPVVGVSGSTSTTASAPAPISVATPIVSAPISLGSSH